MGKAAARKKKVQPRAGMPVQDWRDAIAVLNDAQLKAAMIKQRDGIPEVKGEGRCERCGNETPTVIRPYQPRILGVAEELADLVARRMHPQFETANEPEEIVKFDGRVAMLADILRDLNSRLENVAKLREAYVREPEKEEEAA